MSILTEIVKAKRLENAREMQMHSMASLERELITCPPVRNFKQAICNPVVSSRPALIAEIKKASPSRGLIRENFLPAEHAISYQNGGATCLSVLTDVNFSGCLQHFSEVRAISPLPLLRKDFIIDPWQVLQSRIAGADCILLIMAILSDVEALELYDAAKSYCLDVLVEVHDMPEFERALLLPAQCMIGINNRNLHDFSMDLQTTKTLLKELPNDRVGVSESGIHSPKDVEFATLSGAKAILVGEALMRKPNLKLAVEELLD